MSTMYEKEALFESLDETVCEIKAYVEGAIGQEELHVVEQHLFRRMRRLGRGFLEAFVALSGTGYEKGHPPLSENGGPMAYKETLACPYGSSFGPITIARAAYAHPAGGWLYPIDAQLNLPAPKYSYLLFEVAASFQRRTRFSQRSQPVQRELRFFLLPGPASAPGPTHGRVCRALSMSRLKRLPHKKKAVISP